jgi:hypothetical protein
METRGHGETERGRWGEEALRLSSRAAWLAKRSQLDETAVVAVLHEIATSFLRHSSQ